MAQSTYVPMLTHCELYDEWTQSALTFDSGPVHLSLIEVPTTSSNLSSSTASNFDHEDIQLAFLPTSTTTAHNMSQQNSTSTESFGFSLSFSFLFSIAGVLTEESIPASEPRTIQAASPSTPPRFTDPSETALSPATQNLQRRIREKAKATKSAATQGSKRRIRQKEEERLADEESLYLLESATAMSSQVAKDKDHESLEVLLRCTEHKAKARKVAKSNMANSLPPMHRDVTGINGSPLSWSLSFSAPTTMVSEPMSPLSAPQPATQFAMSMDAEAWESSELEERDEKMLNTLTARLLAVARPELRAAVTSRLLNDKRKAQVQELLELFEKVAEKDAEDGIQEIEDGHKAGEEASEPACSTSSPSCPCRWNGGYNNGSDETFEDPEDGGQDGEDSTPWASNGDKGEGEGNGDGDEDSDEQKTSGESDEEWEFVSSRDAEDETQ